MRIACPLRARRAVVTAGEAHHLMIMIIFITRLVLIIT